VTPLPDSQTIAQAIFIAAIVMLIAILFLKRTVFSPDKIIRNARNLAGSDAEAFVLNKIRRNYLIVWALAELVCLLGFFNFIMLADFQNYLIFAIVSLYSLIVNIPREALIVQSMDMLKEQ
jgi:hypothetical protein